MVVVTRLRLLGTLPFMLLLGGCDLGMLDPAGRIALQQRNLLVASTLLMLLIIVPVIAATLLFAWRYRASNTAATYAPDWHHSTQLEVLIWTAPLLIIIALGALTWISTHTLDPFRPLDRAAEASPSTPEQKPLVIQAVALDWKWLFLYPDEGIAAENELAVPVGVPVSFRITSATVMNSLSVPAVAGQVYAMAGMQTQLHVIVDRAGVYDGMSANYSGVGFSHMQFKLHGLSQNGFDQWVAKARASGTALDTARYLELAKPSVADPVRLFASVQDGLYDKILNMCAEPGTMCQNAMAAIDRGAEAGPKAASLLCDPSRPTGDRQAKADLPPPALMTARD